MAKSQLIYRDKKIYATETIGLPLGAVFHWNGHLNCTERGSLWKRSTSLEAPRDGKAKTGLDSNSGYSNFVCNRQCNHDKMKSTNTELKKDN